MKLRFLSIFTLLFAVLWLGNSPNQAQEERRVWAFYLGFWAGSASWDMQAGVLDDYPSIGRYDSRDGGVAAMILLANPIRQPKLQNVSAVSGQGVSQRAN